MAACISVVIRVYTTGANMSDKPHAWHYGLIAETWAEFSNETPELDFYLRQIERFGQPVLDLVCGTGRVLIPLLKAGIDVDGCDISADMLSLCRKKAAKDGLKPQLYEQAMHELELRRRYRMIYICSSIGLAGSRQLDTDADNAQVIFRSLKEFGAPLVDLTVDDFADEGYFFQMGVPPSRIDILMGIPGPDFEEAWNNRDEIDFEGLGVFFISKEDLITAKLASGRPQDLIDVESLTQGDENSS
jgi:SAM-dependent methyltransferase